MVDPTRPSDSSRVRNEEPPQQEPAPQKSGPSSFDEVLRQNRLPQSPQQQQSAQQGSSVLQREATSRESRTQEQRSRQQDKTETREERRSGDSESRRSEGPSGSRVEAKGQQKEREGGGGQGQGQFSGGRGETTREAGQAKLKDSAKTTAQGDAQGAFAAQLKKAGVPGALSAHHIQQIVNKVLQYFRVKKMATGETELDIGFQEEIFKGLRLRLVQKDGKVCLHILSGEGDVRRLFEKSRDSIEKALTDKGVKLSQIVIGQG
jgi:hypothetical protein